MNRSPFEKIPDLDAVKPIPDQKMIDLYAMIGSEAFNDACHRLLRGIRCSFQEAWSRLFNAVEKGQLKVLFDDAATMKTKLEALREEFPAMRRKIKWWHYDDFHNRRELVTRRGPKVLIVPKRIRHKKFVRAHRRRRR